jgi:hypothetical protein
VAAVEVLRQRSNAIFPFILNGIYFVWGVLSVSTILLVARLILQSIYYWSLGDQAWAKSAANAVDNASDMIHIALMLLIHGMFSIY